MFSTSLKVVLRQVHTSEQHSGEDMLRVHQECSPHSMILPGYKTSDSASRSKFHYLALLALLVVLVLHYGDSADLNFAIL